MAVNRRKTKKVQSFRSDSGAIVYHRTKAEAEKRFRNPKAGVGKGRKRRNPTLDAARASKRTVSFDDPKGLEEWYKHPNRLDLEGVDTPQVNSSSMKGDVDKKYPWQMTLSELNATGYIAYDTGIKSYVVVPSKAVNESVNTSEHKRLVMAALAEGKKVPQRVLNDYPDLEGVDTPASTYHTSPQQTRRGEDVSTEVGFYEKVSYKGKDYYNIQSIGDDKVTLAERRDIANPGKTIVVDVKALDNRAAVPAAKAPLYFDDDYTGTRYTYGLVNRPLAKGNVPDGWIIGSDRVSISDPEARHGTVDYPEPLTEEQIKAFELKPLNSRAKNELHLERAEKAVKNLEALTKPKSEEAINQRAEVAAPRIIEGGQFEWAQQPMKDANDGLLYVDNAGNYHLKKSKAASSGPIAPYNKELKAQFPDMWGGSQLFFTTALKVDELGGIKALDNRAAAPARAEASKRPDKYYAVRDVEGDFNKIDGRVYMRDPKDLTRDWSVVEFSNDDPGYMKQVRWFKTRDKASEYMRKLNDRAWEKV